MKTLGTVTIAALLSAGFLTATATSALARVVCNQEGDCWHVNQNYDYHPEFKLTVHPDEWKWKDGDKFKFREHEGRGYWQGGIWIPF